MTTNLQTILERLDEPILIDWLSWREFKAVELHLSPPGVRLSFLDGVWEIRLMRGRKHETAKQRISTLSRSARCVSGDRPCSQIFLSFASDSTWTNGKVEFRVDLGTMHSTVLGLTRSTQCLDQGAFKWLPGAVPPFWSGFSREWFAPFEGWLWGSGWLWVSDRIMRKSWI